MSVSLLLMEVRKNFFPEKVRLLQPVIAPEFEHHLGASGGVVFLQPFDTLFW